MDKTYNHLFSLPDKITNIVHIDFKTDGKGQMTGWKVVWRDIQEENNWTYIENMLKIIAHVYNILTIHAVVVFLALFKNGTLRMKVRSPTK